MEGQQAKKPNQPILIKCSLKRHSPEEIYDYLQMNIGDLGMKIKKGQAIIGFEDRDLYDKLLREHKIIKLHGKKLQFIPFPKVEENYLSSEEQQVVDLSKCITPGAYPEFKASNKIQARINASRVSMMDKIQQLFVPTIQATRERVSHLYLQFKEQGPRQREMLSLMSAVEKKYKAIETRYDQDIKKINKFINQFSVKPTTIDLQPTFVFEQTWKFPKITDKNMSFQACNYFKNNFQGYSCKRLCAINGKQFAVTTSNIQKMKGFVKIFDVHETENKGEIAVDKGAYGICRLNNFLLLGGLDSTIKFLNLQDSQKSVESSKTLSQKYLTSFFDIKCFKKSVDRPEILTLSTDHNLRRFEVSFQQITTGLYTVSFEEKHCINGTHNITFDIMSSQAIIYGGERRIKKYLVQKNVTKQIMVNDGPIKIKKFNDNVCAVASSKFVEMVDLRAEAVVQTFSHMPPQMKALEVIGDHSLMFGAKGVIGLLDDRKQQVFPWKSEGYHKSVVYDILKLEDRIVSCDWEGKIYSWRLSQQIGHSSAPPVEVSEGALRFQFNKNMIL